MASAGINCYGTVLQGSRGGGGRGRRRRRGHVSRLALFDGGTKNL